MRSVNSCRAASSNTKSSRAKRSIALAAAAAASLAAPGLQKIASANPFFWVGDHDGNWNTTGGPAGTNWSSSNLFNSDPATLPGSGDDVTFVLFGAGNLNTSLGQNFTIHSLNFTTDAVATDTITIGGNNTLTINGGGINDNSPGTITISTAIALGGNQTWTNTSSVPLTVSGVVSGNSTTNLTVAGTGGIALSAANTYSGSTSIANLAVLTINGADGSILNTSGLTIGGGGTLNLDSTGSNQTSQNRIADSLTITSNGGTINLLGNSVTPTTETVGTLALGSGQSNVNVTGNGAVLTFGNATLSSFSRSAAGSAVNFSATGTGSIAAPDVTLSNSIIGGWATIGNITSSSSSNVLDFATVTGGNVAALGSYTNNNVVGDFVAGNNVKFGTNGSNTALTGTLTGNATINSLYITGNTILGLGGHTLVISSGGIISNAATGNVTLNGQPNQLAEDVIGSANQDGAITSSGADLVVTTASNLQINSIITGNIGLTKDGSGLLDLSNGNNGGPANTFRGTVTINGGILAVKADNNLGNSTNALVLNGGELRTYSGFTFTNSITAGPQGGTFSYAGGSQWNITAAIGGTGGMTFKPISTVNVNVIDLDPSSTYTYSGPTVIAAGGNSTTEPSFLQLLKSQVFPANTAFSVTSATNVSGQTFSGYFDLNGFTQTVGSLSGNASIVSSLPGAILNVGGNNLSTTYSGSIAPTFTSYTSGGPGIRITNNPAITLNKTGTGTLTLSGSTLAYTGATNISGGTLLVNGDMSGTSQVNVFSATLGGNGTITAPVVVSATGHLSPEVTPSSTSTLNITGNLTIDAGATFDYNFAAPGTSDTVAVTGNVNMLSGNDTLNVTQLSGFGIGNYTLVSATGSITDNANLNGSNIVGSTNFNYATAIVGNSLVLEVTAGNPSLIWTGSVNGNWDATTPNWTSASAGSLFLTGANVQFDDADLSGNAATAITVQAGGVSANSGNFSNSSASYSFMGGNITITGPGITKSGGGLVTFNNTVTTPATTINGGTIAVGNGGSYTSTTLRVNNGGTLSVSGNGSLGATSTLVLNGNATFSNGNQTIAGLSDTLGATTGVLALNNSAATLTVAAGNSTYDGIITGNGSLAVSSGASVTLTNANTFSGNTTVSGSGSTLVISNSSGSATGGGNVTIQSGGTLSGTGITAGGLVTISAGTLSPAGNGTVGTITLASLALQNGATLQYDIANGLAGPNDLTAVTGAATLSGNESLTVNNPSLLAAGNYTLIAAASVTDTANFTGNITIAVPSSLQNYSVQKVGNSVDLVVTFTSPTWTGANGSTWDTVTANWSPSPTGVFLQHEGAIFDNTLAGGNSGNTSVNVVGNIITDGGLTFNNTTAVTYTITSTDAGDQISGLGGITVNGNGTVNIVSNAMNTFTGATVLNAGVLNVDSLADGGVASAIGQATNDPSNLVFNGGTLQYTNNQSGFFPMSTDHLFTLGPSGGTIDSSAPQSSAIVQFTNPGAIAFSGTGNRTLTLTGSNLGDGATIAGTNSLAASIGDAVPGTSLTKVLKTGAGAWALIGSNSYTGGTTISAGTLMTAADNNLGASASPVLINGSGATLWISTNAVTGTHDITIGASGGTLQIDNSYTLSGNSSLLEGSGPLTIKGPGTLVLNTPNNFTGSVLVDPSKLYVNGSLPAASTVTVASGSNLGGTGTVHGAVVVQGGGSIEGGQNLAGQLTIGGPVTFQGAATVNIGNLAAYVPGTAAIVDQGTVSTDGTDTIGFSLNGSAPSTGTFALFDFHGATPTTPAGFALAGASNPHLGASLHTVTIAPSTQEVQLTLNVTPIVWTNGSTNSLWDINTSQNWKVPPSTATNYFEGDIVSFDDTATGGNPQNITIAPASVNPNGVTFNNNAVAYTIGGGAIAGATGVTLNGNGLVTFTGSNSYTGGTSINSGGTLSIAADSALGAVPASPAINLTLNGGTLQIAANTAYNVATIATNRGITLGAAGGTINVTQVATGTFASSNTGVQYFGAIAGTSGGNLTITGTGGTNTLAAPYLSEFVGNTYNGQTFVNNAAVAIMGVGGPYTNVLPATTVLNLANNGMFVMDQSTSSQSIAGLNGDSTTFITTTNSGSANPLTITPANGQSYNYAGIIGPQDFLAKTGGAAQITLTIAGAGSGTQILSGANTYAGLTSINGGTLRANNASGSALGTGAVAVNSGGTLGGTGFTGNGTVTVNSGGAITAGADATHAGNFTVGDGTNGNLTMAGGASYLWKLNDFNGNLTGTPGTNWDLVNVNGALTFSGNTAVTVAMAAYGGATPAQGAPVNNFSGNQTFEIASFASTNLAGVTAGGNQTIQLTDPTTGLGTGAYTGLFALNTSGFTNEPAASTDGAAFLEFIGSGAGTGGTLDVSYGTYTATPEPGTTLLVLAGGLPMLAVRRRRRQPKT